MPKNTLYALLIAMTVMVGNAYSLTADEAKGMSVGDGDARIAALRKAVTQADDKTLAFIQALSDDGVKLVAGKPVVIQGGQGVDPVSGQVVPVPDTAEDVMNNNRMRGELDAALAAAKLLSTDIAVRREAIKTLQGDVDESRLPVLDKAFAAETDAALKASLGLLRAAAMLGSTESAKRMEAAELLAASSQAATKTLLIDRIQSEPDAAVKTALQKSLREVESRLAWGDRLGALFSGLSLGSILLLVALGLAITYGLMGVINMAHGELMMIGAYATYVVQGLFQKYLPGAFDWYLLASVPVAFVASALVGAALSGFLMLMK